MINDNSMFSIHTMELGPMENFVYLVIDNQSKRAAVVDPAWEVDQVIDVVKQKNLIISDILLTHSHYDHVNGVDTVLQHYDAQVHLLKPEAEFWGKFTDATTQHHGGDTIKLGNTEINMLHTPGHTPGSCCYHVGNQLIAGDTLFVFGCGRCDLAGGDPHQMFHTLKHIKQNLPANTVVLPGHNYAEQTTSTLEEQVKGNPFLHFEKETEFVHYRMIEHDKIRDTPYKPINK